MPHNNDNDIENDLRKKLDALPNPTDRLLYDIDYDDKLVVDTAKGLLAHNPFPLSPKLDNNCLTIFVAFASAMANDEYAELDSFYNRLSEIFFGNLVLSPNQQNEVRDFVERTCKRFKLRFLRNQNRLVRNTIWLHGGLPSRHWKNFFEQVLMKVDDSLNNLDELLDPPTPKTIKRFFELCGNSARAFLNDCIEMRDALSENDKDACAEDFGVSEPFFNAFVEYLRTSHEPSREKRPKLLLDSDRNVVVNQETGSVVAPKRDIYAFNAKNGKHLRGSEFQLPKRKVILVHHQRLRIPSNVPRWIESESMGGDWKDYRCEWLDLSNQSELVLQDGAEQRVIEVSDAPNVVLVGNAMMLNGRAVYVITNDGKTEVYTKLPELVIENCCEHSLSRLRLFVNGERKEININSRIPLSALELQEGVHAIRVRGAKGIDTLHFAYLPDLKLRLNKNEYRANETPILSVGQNQVLLPTEKNRVEISYNNLRLSIPIPRQAWRIGDGSFSSELISITSNMLPSSQATTFLEAMFCTTHTSVKFLVRNNEQICCTEVIRLNDASCRIDLARFRDCANANIELDFLFQFENGETIKVLKTYKEWEPKICMTIRDKTVSFEIVDNAEGFKNRELVFWNLCRLWEKPIVLPVPDDEKAIAHTFEHEGEYIVQARTKRTGWGEQKELSPFDVPAKSNLSFRIGNSSFKEFIKKREEVLLEILLHNCGLRVEIKEYVAILVFLLRRQQRESVKKWICLFLALPKRIQERFQEFLYSENHQSVEDLRGEYERIVCSIVNKNAIVTQFQEQHLEVTFRSMPFQQSELNGFKLIWRTNATEVKIKNKSISVSKGFRPTGEHFVETESLDFYTLIAKKNSRLALATVAVAREPLILCFQAIQLDNTNFKLMWKVNGAFEVEIHPIGNVKTEGERIIQPKHGETYTLVALGNNSISEKAVKTEFAKPHIEKFVAVSINTEEMIEVAWQTYRADVVSIEPNIAIVGESGKMQVPIAQLQSGIKLVAINKGGPVEKELKIETELPNWFQRGVMVKISSEEKTFYAKVGDVLFNASGQLIFCNQQVVNFTIFHSAASKVYVRIEDASKIYELSHCKGNMLLSKLDDFISHSH